MVLFLAVLMLVATVSTSYAWDRGGRHNQRHYDYGRHHNYDHHRHNYWHDVGAGLYILGGAAVLGAITSPYNYGYQPYQERYCKKEIRYGYWEIDGYGREVWVTTRVEFEPVPCRRW